MKDVTVTNPDGGSTSKHDGFEVSPPGPNR